MNIEYVVNEICFKNEKVFNTSVTRKIFENDVKDVKDKLKFNKIKKVFKVAKNKKN